MRLVLFGDPVAHSRSPAIHTAALAAVGIEGTYRAVRVDEAGLAEAVAEMRFGRLDGSNVTMPHKGVAARLADAADDLVTITGASNTLRHRDGRVEATNTDVGGIGDAAHRAGIPEAPVLILGGGGGAAAARLAFRDRDVVLSGRSASGHPWGVPLPGAVVVNATPLGMAGEPLPDGVVEEAVGLIDMAYGEGSTPAAALARSLGMPVADGLELLVSQAARSFTWWTGVEAPIEVMRKAAREA